MVRFTSSAMCKGVAATLALVMVVAPVSAVAQVPAVSNTTLIPLTGTTADGQAFASTFRLQRFQHARGQILAVGVLESGTLNGQSLVGQAVAIPVKVEKEGNRGRDHNRGDDGDDEGGFGGFGSIQDRDWKAPNFAAAEGLQLVPVQATCTILHLTLGPLDLNLLGLLVHLDRVVLNIDAQPGGGLLGDLLCGIANLLAGLNLLTTLNRIVSILNQLGL